MNSKNIFLSLIVPVFNEEKRFEKSLPEAHQYLLDNFEQSELIYVDDGSTDHTYDKLMEATALYPRLRVVRSDRNYGKGHAIQSGFKSAAGSVLLFSDADFSTPVEETGKLLEVLTRGFDIVIGSRGLRDSQVQVHQSIVRETMGKVFNLMIRLILPLEFRDTQCGFKMFTRAAAESIVSRMHIEGFAFDVEMLMIGKQLDLHICEMPVVWRNVRESKVHPVRNSIEMIRDLLRIRRRLRAGQYS
jgi:dolichyl-phosphate beta-glucosyltransferase